MDLNNEAISLATAVVITGRSRRTWWRRVADGTALRMADDAKGRTMLRLQDVEPSICVAMDADDLDQLVRADAGDAEAQDDMGQLFLNAGEPKVALHWLELAASQGHADAMQWLGHCYVSGEGVARDRNVGVMWIAKAAAHGHMIAQAQMRQSLGVAVQASAVQ